MASDEKSAWRPALVTFASLVAAGALGGVLWQILWTPPTFSVFEGSAGLDEVALSQQFTSDAWYAVVALPMALTVAVLRRRFSGRSGLLDLGGAVVGAVAAAYAMLWTGQLLGPSFLTDAQIVAQAQDGPVSVPLALTSQLASDGWASHVYAVMLAWPLGVLAGWVAELIVPSLEPPQVRREREEQAQQQEAPEWWRQPDGGPENGHSDETFSARQGAPPAPPS